MRRHRLVLASGSSSRPSPSRPWRHTAHGRARSWLGLRPAPRSRRTATCAARSAVRLGQVGVRLRPRRRTPPSLVAVQRRRHETRRSGSCRWRSHRRRLSRDSCKVPQGAYLLISPGGFECSKAEGNGSTAQELRACAGPASPASRRRASRSGHEYTHARPLRQGLAHGLPAARAEPLRTGRRARR